MKLRALALTAWLATLGTGSLALAQQPASSSKDEGGLNLPVSLDKIRAGLAQPVPAEPLKGLNDPPPTSTVEIREQQKFTDLLSNWKLDKGGRRVPGGTAH